MIYADAIQATADGVTSPKIFEESIQVVELALIGSASSLVTARFFHSIGGRLYRKIAVMTVNAANPTVDMHLIPAWPPGLIKMEWEEAIP